MTTRRQLDAAAKPTTAISDERPEANAFALLDEEAKDFGAEAVTGDPTELAVPPEVADKGLEAGIGEPAKESWADEVEEEEARTAQQPREQAPEPEPEDGSWTTVGRAPASSVSQADKTPLWRRTGRGSLGSGTTNTSNAAPSQRAYAFRGGQYHYPQPFSAGVERDMSSPWRRGTARSRSLAVPSYLSSLEAPRLLVKADKQPTVPAAEITGQSAGSPQIVRMEAGQRTTVLAAGSASQFAGNEASSPEDSAAGDKDGCSSVKKSQPATRKRAPQEDLTSALVPSEAGLDNFSESASLTAESHVLPDEASPSADDESWNVVQRNRPRQRQRASLEELSTALWPLAGCLNRHRASFPPANVQGPVTREGDAPWSTRYGVMSELMSRCNTFAHLMGDTDATAGDTAGDGLTYKQIKDALTSSARTLYPKLREAFTGENRALAPDPNGLWRQPMTSMLALMRGRTATLTEESVKELEPLVYRLRQDLRAAIRKHESHGQYGRFDYPSYAPSVMPRGQPNARQGSGHAKVGTSSTALSPSSGFPAHSSSTAHTTKQFQAGRTSGGPGSSMSATNAGTVTFDLRSGPPKVPLDTHITRNRQQIRSELVTLWKDLHGHQSSFIPSRYSAHARRLGNTSNFEPMFERPNVIEEVLNSVRTFTKYASGGWRIPHDGLGRDASDEDLTERLSADSAKLYVELCGHLRGTVTNIPDNVHMLWKQSYEGKLYVQEGFDQEIQPNHIRQLLKMATSLEHSLESAQSRYERVDGGDASMVQWRPIVSGRLS